MGRNRGFPKYRRIADALLADWQRRDPASIRVPSERELALRFAVARNTARRALEYLRDGGAIGRIHGSGSYLTRSSEQHIYGLTPSLQIAGFEQFYKWVGKGLNAAGYQLVVLKTGNMGESFVSDLKASVLNAASGLIWIPPHLREGNRRAERFRRHLARRLPMVLISDDLGVSLQGVHRVDLVHFDWLLSAERLVGQLWAQGRRHPVLGLWTTLTSFALDQLRLGFTDALRRRGVAEPEAHVWPWSVGQPEPLAACFRAAQAAGWQPDSVMLHPGDAAGFRAICGAAGYPLAPEAPVVSSADPSGELYLPVDFRQTADVCLDLMLSRLRQPNRPNMRVAVNVPVRRRRHRAADRARPALPAESR